jgi:hypothetical protein
MLKLAMLLCVLTAMPVFSAIHRVPEDEPLITIEIPDEWQTKEVGESLHAAAPDPPLDVLIVPPEGSKIAETMGEAMRYIRNRDRIVVKPESMKKTQPGKINGLDVHQVSWQGNNKNGEVEIQFTILSVVNRKSVLLAWWGSPAAVRRHEADLKKILQSVKRAGADAQN